MNDVLGQWHDPVFGEAASGIPAALAARLEAMAVEFTAGEDVAAALNEWRVGRNFAVLPTGMRIYYERLFSLLTLAMLARDTDTTRFDHHEPPSEAEKSMGFVIGQAFHMGCSLDDVALASGLAPEQVVAIGKRTIRRTKWLDRL